MARRELDPLDVVRIVERQMTILKMVGRGQLDPKMAGGMWLAADTWEQIEEERNALLKPQVEDGLDLNSPAARLNAMSVKLKPGVYPLPDPKDL